MRVQIDADGGALRLERRSWNQLTVVTNALGHEWRQRSTREDVLASMTDPGGTVTEFTYDRNLRLRGVRRGGELRDIYLRDGVGNLTEKRGADGSTLLTLTPTPDRLVAERRLASGSVHRFTYDADGRVTTAHSEGASVECEHDVSGSRVRDTRDGRGVIHAPGVTTVLDRYTIERDTSRNSVTLRLQGGGSVRLRRLPGGVVRRDFGCGATELLQFDALGRCTASAVALPAEAGPWLRSWRYSYEGDLREANCSRNGLTRYRYDAAHRLVEADAGSGKRSTFSHDAAGNLISPDPDEEQPTSPPDADAALARPMTDTELQSAADYIRRGGSGAGTPDPNDFSSLTVTQGMEDGEAKFNVQTSRNSGLTDSEANRANQVFGDQVNTGHEGPIENDGTANNHSEQRGMRATQDQTDRVQATSNNTVTTKDDPNVLHAGAACRNFSAAQQNATDSQGNPNPVRNATGTVADGGRTNNPQGANAGAWRGWSADNRR